MRSRVANGEAGGGPGGCFGFRVQNMAEANEE